MVRSVQNQSVRDWLGTMRSQENFVPDIVVGIDFGMTVSPYKFIASSAHH